MVRNFFREFGYVLNLCRFSALMLAAGFLMMLVDQGRDVLIGIAENENIILGFLFGIPVLVWAFNTWYWARVILDFSFPDAPPTSNLQRWLRDHLPRTLGALTFVAVGYAFINASEDAGDASSALVMFACVFFVYAIGFYVLVLCRRRLARYLAKVLDRKKNAVARKLVLWIKLPEESDLPYKRYADLLPVTRVNLRFWLGLGTVFFLFATIAPVTAGAAAFDPAVVFFLWAGTFIPLGTLAVYASHRYGFPVLLSLFLLAVLFSTFNDNHELRRVDKGSDVGERPTVAQAVDTWFRSSQTQKWMKNHGDRRVPFVIVATAGGGSRAAYWTATVLGKIQDADPKFRDHLFAISGVSGGSLGATVFRAILANGDRYGTMSLCIRKREPPINGEESSGKWKTSSKDKDKETSNSVAACGQEILKQDFLSPTVAAFLFPDLVQRFLPLPQSVSLPDRAAALEKAWEHAWGKFMPKADKTGLSKPFLDLWPHQNNNGGKSWPALFLNGTWVQTGRRIVTSNLQPVRRRGKARKPEEGECPDGVDQKVGGGKVQCVNKGAFGIVYDLLFKLGRDVPASTAANNSARFPILGPAGTMRNAKTGELIGRVVDGGYFENFGAATAREILVEAKVALGKLGEDAKKVWFILIQISSDPTIPQGGDPGAVDNKPMHFGYELRSPVRTFLQARSARGLDALKAFQSEVSSGNGKTRNGVFLHFQMCKDKGSQDPPLGWTLSDAAASRIDTYIDGKAGACSKKNKAHIDTILKLLKKNPQ